MAMVIVTVLWVVVGFGLCFGPSIGGIIGDPSSNFLFNGVSATTAWELAPTIPLLLFAFFQAKFAIITPALITGAFAERIRFWAYLLFMVLFILVIYAPLCHMTWHPDGLFFKMGVLDFAGGTVVHMSAGWAALAGAIFSYYLCIIRNWFIMVWLVRFQCRICCWSKWTCCSSIRNNYCSCCCCCHGLGILR
jgi:Amt family ammonium transporter